jgi:hypothetical protein
METNRTAAEREPAKLNEVNALDARRTHHRLAEPLTTATVVMRDEQKAVSGSRADAAGGAAGVGLDEPFAVAGQVSQVAGRWRGDEGAAQQAVFEQFGQPFGVQDVAFASGLDLHVLGVDQLQLERPLFEHVPDRFPVRAGERGERAGPLAPAPPAWSGGPHAGDHLVLADVDPRAPLDQHVHQW